MASAPAVLATAAMLLSIAATAGCGSGDGDGTTDCGALFAGDLVITEVMANPAGEDQGNEYFEIFNTSDQPIDLGGLELVASREDETDAKSHVMTETIIAPGQYLALGGVLPEFRAAWIDYGYGEDLGAFRNAGGRIALRCGKGEIDALVYPEMSDGRSQGLDGNIPPDHIANDDLENFCSATTEFANEAFGSPGVANEPCSIVDQTTCLDGDTMRDVVKPQLGDLVITEVMPNPDAEFLDGAGDPITVSDAKGEWFEIAVLGDFDLNGLVAGQEVGNPKINITAPECLSVTAGDFLLFARGSDPLTNGNLPPVDFTFSFGLTNGGGSLFVGGDVVLDTLSWDGSRPGASVALDPTKTTPEANDVLENFCDGSVAWFSDETGTSDLGTPGAANLPCDTAGMCQDGDALRPTVAPVAADVTITEIMANPAAVNDSAGEWFEVHFAAAADLNGLELGKDLETLAPAFTIDDVACQPVAADTYVIFSRNTDAATNGGLPTTDHFGAGISLTNSSDSLFVSLGGELLDSTTYDGSTAGVSLSLDPDGTPWCPATTPYGTGEPPDLGTPGDANPQCP